MDPPVVKSMVPLPVTVALPGMDVLPVSVPAVATLTVLAAVNAPSTSRMPAVTLVGPV